MCSDTSRGSWDLTYRIRIKTPRPAQPRPLFPPVQHDLYQAAWCRVPLAEGCAVPADEELARFASILFVVQAHVALEKTLRALDWVWNTLPEAMQNPFFLVAVCGLAL